MKIEGSYKGDNLEIKANPKSNLVRIYVFVDNSGDVFEVKKDELINYLLGKKNGVM